MIDDSIDILVMGAGMAGLTAAKCLHESGKKVVVIDKSRGVGGRMTNRRFGGAVFDHGAQYVTVQSPRWFRQTQSWAESGLLKNWVQPSDECGETLPAFRAVPTMSALAKQLAEGLEIRLQHKSTSVSSMKDGWLVEIDQGETLFASSLLITAPVPQSLELLEAGSVNLAAWQRERMEKIKYDKCFAVMAILDEPSRIPSPGLYKPSEGPIQLLADNQQKGISSIPAVTIHATPEYSEKNWDRDRSLVTREILEASQPYLGASVVDSQIHGWRYSRPSSVATESCLIISYDPLLILAGDAFGSSSLEGAALSGRAASDILLPLPMLNTSTSSSL